MGFRTLVLLHNDNAHVWSKDQLLGEKIAHAMNYTHVPIGFFGHQTPDLGYGRVVECTHADTQTVAIIDSYHFDPIARSHWRRGEETAARDLRLMKEAADRLGYRLVKKS